MARSSADSQYGAATKSTPSQRPSDRFLAALKPFQRVVFVSHVNPDPDSLGSMLGLSYLVEKKLRKKTLITRDGLISRAENRAMVEALDLDPVPVQKVEWTDQDAVVMVDSQPNTGRHTICKTIPIQAVIDHHETPGELTGIPFHDICPSLGATCTLVTRYLREHNLTPTERVATALLYGLETEVTGYPRESSDEDDDALIQLYSLADKDLLARIRNARLPHCYFECFLQAMQSSFLYDRLIISWVRDMAQPEQAAEVADLLIRFEEVDWAVCVGVCDNTMVLSARAAIANAGAGELLRKVVAGLGRAGGHDRRAGGCIPLSSTSDSAVEEMQSELRRRLLKQLQIEGVRGQRLVPLREMLSNLS